MCGDVRFSGTLDWSNFAPQRIRRIRVTVVRKRTTATNPNPNANANPNLNSNSTPTLAVTLRVLMWCENGPVAKLSNSYYSSLLTFAALFL